MQLQAEAEPRESAEPGATADSVEMSIDSDTDELRERYEAERLKRKTVEKRLAKTTERAKLIMEKYSELKEHSRALAKKATARREKAEEILELLNREKAQRKSSEEARASLADKGYALGDVALGDPAAQVTIVEYASLTCPHCANFHINSFPPIKADYIDTGKAKLVVREIFFDQFGLWSTMIARSGGEAAYHPMIDMFLNRQRDWYQSHVRAYNETKNPQPIIDEMMKIGRLAGLSNERMNEALSDQEFLERLVTDFQTYSADDNVRSTPTFFINGEEVSGAVSATEMSRVIETKL